MLPAWVFILLKDIEYNHLILIALIVNLMILDQFKLMKINNRLLNYKSMHGIKKISKKNFMQQKLMVNIKSCKKISKFLMRVLYQLNQQFLLLLHQTQLQSQVEFLKANNTLEIICLRCLIFIVIFKKFVGEIPTLLCLPIKSWSIILDHLIQLKFKP